MTGVLSIRRQTTAGELTTVTKEDIDFEQTWWDGKTLIIKGYDSHEEVIQIGIAAEILMTELLGFAAEVEIVKNIDELPPRHGEPR